MTTFKESNGEKTHDSNDYLSASPKRTSKRNSVHLNSNEELDLVEYENQEKTLKKDLKRIFKRIQKEQRNGAISNIVSNDSMESLVDIQNNSMKITSIFTLPKHEVKKLEEREK